MCHSAEQSDFFAEPTLPYGALRFVLRWSIYFFPGYKALLTHFKIC
ncbi:hypothetical protein KL86DES1_20210 [uncultured Desulfovibrio sp.]|uniref:Uncharacterized protein n=1 Tax=uncultured Desulfovibrio sp. TaxID=167968 RepID=A0A212L2M1_9BACT|nr:hypothetical protein KL86DES1_20210 [uncultured Desulfovibrio sp.]VZH33111.1 conserved protein of unknown function [Desulfovibrio sp. 86]